MTSTTGLDPVDIAMIGVGSVVERVYFCVPDQYVPALDGEKHDLYADALLQGIKHVKARIEKYRETRGEDHQAPETFWVDSRWLINRCTDAGLTSNVDLVVSRTRYDSLEEAVAHLDRIGLYS